jgi:hypothetical protein
MRNLWILATLLAGILNAQDRLPAQDTNSGRNLWRTSVTALAVANTLDIHSSWGKYELNPALSGPHHEFGAQGALLKLGFQGAVVGIEYLVTRHRPSRKLYQALSIMNFGASAAIGSVAAHNYSVPRAPR